MNIILNGEAKQLDSSQSLAELMDSLEVDLNKIAVERNSEIIPRSMHADISLAEGDRIEIVEFIGGG